MRYERLIKVLLNKNLEKPCIIQITGPRDSGKTLLITKIVEKIRKEGFSQKIIVIKHSHHKNIDVEDKDTFRYLKSGAEASLIAVDSGFGVFSSTIDPTDLVNIDFFDIIFIEGFKELTIGLKIDLSEKNTDIDYEAEKIYRYLLEKKCLHK